MTDKRATPAAGPSPAGREVQEIISDEKTAINKRVQARYDELMREGKHGHYETMFRVVHEERAAAAGQGRAELIEALRNLEEAAREVYRICERKTDAFAALNAALCAAADMLGRGE